MWVTGHQCAKYQLPTSSGVDFYDCTRSKLLLRNTPPQNWLRAKKVKYEQLWVREYQHAKYRHHTSNSVDFIAIQAKKLLLRNTPPQCWLVAKKLKHGPMWVSICQHAKYQPPTSNHMDSKAAQAENCYCAIHPLKIGRVPNFFRNVNFGSEVTNMQSISLLHQTGWISIGGQSFVRKETIIIIIIRAKTKGSILPYGP